MNAMNEEKNIGMIFNDYLSTFLPIFNEAIAQGKTEKEASALVLIEMQSHIEKMAQYV